MFQFDFKKKLTFPDKIVLTKRKVKKREISKIHFIEKMGTPFF